MSITSMSDETEHNTSDPYPDISQQESDRKGKAKKLTTSDDEDHDMATDRYPGKGVTTDESSGKDMMTIEDQVKADFARASVEQFLLTCRNSGMPDADVQELIADALQEFFVNLPGEESDVPMQN